MPPQQRAVPPPPGPAPTFDMGGGGDAPDPFYGDPENFPTPTYTSGSVRAFEREQQEAAPRYGPVTGQTARNILRNLRPEEIAQVQEVMKAVGLMPDGKYAFGLADPRTTQGFQRLLSYANETGQDWERALGEMTASALAAKEQEEADGGPDRQGSFNRIRQSAPQTVDEVFDKAFQTALGKKPTAAQKARFRKAYLGYERRTQQQDIAQEAAAVPQLAAGQDVTVTATDPVSLDTYAEDYARAQDPAGAAATDTTRVMDDFFQMLDPGGFT